MTCWQVLPLPLENFEPEGIKQSEADLKIICILKKEGGEVIAITHGINNDAHIRRVLICIPDFSYCIDRLSVLCKCWSCTMSVIHSASFHMHRNTHAHTKQCMSKPIGGGHADYSKSALHCCERNRFLHKQKLMFHGARAEFTSGFFFCRSEARSQIFTYSIAQRQSVCADTWNTAGACHRLCHSGFSCDIWHIITTVVIMIIIIISIIILPPPQEAVLLPLICDA